MRARALAGGILSQSWEAQLLELEARLAASSAHMKLLVGHHPVRSRRQVGPFAVSSACACLSLESCLCFRDDMRCVRCVVFLVRFSMPRGLYSRTELAGTLRFVLVRLLVKSC